MNDLERLVQKAERERITELEQEALRAHELRARIPHIVLESIEQLLEEADDLEHARQLAGLDED